MFFAYQDTRSPVIASAANLVFFAAVSLLLMGPFEHVGIAMGLSAAGAAQLLVLLVLLRRRVGRLGLRAVVVGAARISVAAAAMGGALWGVARLGAWNHGATWPNVGVLASAIAAGVLTFVAVAAALRSPELKELLDAVRRRVKR